MARREPKLVGVMMRIEPSLDDILRQLLIEEDDTASTFMRSLLIKELARRERIPITTARVLMGA
jgi:hypothetical protein